ncbi:MAG: betaine--homocysteine S-methyltransferase [Actinobacteria bacterium]|jgi:5-methyltetrahydrofolate--homocysteine methyltransferase|nr:betaine--homocysteine S-methyltransferase [Actinomycetota bacterium]MBT3746250.1 betaine--homocysteine S-methyltransferase [Actinomycetota bacterium]MBT3969845.1 betaine--homocysteine S-methyltransferase [Actinomycetota bacterium]MBT4009403.1 betaine--homocysteine S-methyltransferase [Actinomycetota bacterium]MBT4302615.1 betaine--homocysteine S-methyltransferase [Actinomycetota bacterium]
MNALNDLLETNGYLVIDGAMGTELFAAGLTSGDSPELWNVENPEAVQAVHRAYVAAGSDIILTNTFGGTRFRMKLHKLQDRVDEINQAATANARLAADEVERTVLVAGSMGPTGELLFPLGELTAQEAQEGFAEQAAALTAGGADLLWLETLSSLEEMEAGVKGAQSVSDLPIVVTMSYDTAGRTMMGVTGTEMGARLAELGVSATGANCGANLADTESAVTQIKEANGGLPVVSKGNAGIPVWVGSDLHYDGTPEIMAAHAYRLRQAGISIIGSCCGSTPEHIAYISAVLKGEKPVPDVEPPVGTQTNPQRENGGTRRRRRNRD